MKYYDMKSPLATRSLLQTENALRRISDWNEMCKTLDLDELQKMEKYNPGPISDDLINDAHTYIAEYIVKISEDLSNANGMDEPLNWTQLSVMMESRKPVWRQIDRDYGEWMMISKMETDTKEEINTIWDHNGAPWTDDFNYFRREQRYYDDYLSI